jgi:putative AlgH/UPF0301 family transcriptional regulator
VLTATLPRTPRPPCLAARRAGGGGDAGGDAAGSSLPDALPVAGPETDWRAYRARLAAMEAAAAAPAAGGAAAATPAFEDGRWAHSLPQPETGCVLLAHPSMFDANQTYFKQAAILILESNESGALGVILNRPTTHKLREVQFTDDGLLDSFASCKLYLGGDVGRSNVIVVTSSPRVEDATEVAAGIRVCTLAAAAAAVKAGAAAPGDFRFYAQYSGWGPGQLQRECKAGVW